MIQPPQTKLIVGTILTVLRKVNLDLVACFSFILSEISLILLSLVTVKFNIIKTLRTHKIFLPKAKLKIC